MFESKKDYEKRIIEIFKNICSVFPAGAVIIHEEQERPDAIVDSPSGRIGIEITSIHEQSLKRNESESEAVVSEAQEIYEKCNPTKLQVSVLIGNAESLKRNNRTSIASAIANLVSANVPDKDGVTEIENDWNDSAQFPFEINSILIFRNKALTRNHWTCGSSGFIQENIADRLQQIISEKDKRLDGYDPNCIEHWLSVHQLSLNHLRPRWITDSNQHLERCSL
jgi:hypothetical protein